MARRRRMTVQQALNWVAHHPEPATDDFLELPVYELVSRSLFDIANHPDPNNRRSLQRSNKARRLIFARLVGTRRPGTHPAQRASEALLFRDLTQGALDE